MHQLTSLGIVWADTLEGWPPALQENLQPKGCNTCYMQCWDMCPSMHSRLDVELLASALRSDAPDLEAEAAAAASPNPNLENQRAAQPAAAAANMHRVTGTFADPSHESTFSAGLFRMACPTHVLLMALVLPYSFCSALVEPDMRAPRAAPHRPAETAWALVLDSSVELTHFGSDTLCHFHAALVLLV